MRAVVLCARARAGRGSRSSPPAGSAARATAALLSISVCLPLCVGCHQHAPEPGKIRIAHAPTGPSLHLIETPTLVCGLEKGVARCVGPDQTDPVAGVRLEVDEPVVALAGGPTHVCALGLSGAVFCVGDDYAPRELAEDAAGSSLHAPRAIPLPGSAHSLIGAANRTCAVHASGRATCWSPGELTTYTPHASRRLNRLAQFIGPQPSPPRRNWIVDPARDRERFLRRLSALDIVAAHDILEFSCAVEASGTLHCHHGAGFPILLPRALSLLPLTLRCNWAGCCLLGTTGALECWGTERDLAASIPVDAASFVVGADTLCFAARRREGPCHRVSCMASPWVYPDKPSTYYTRDDTGGTASTFYGENPAPTSLCIDLPRGGPGA
ncbi:MAG: hypothetical protein KF729_37255 [Sandaracinaceae bacterium]|nr:hypothetical protein [Sandaracinaceae bacterium]